MYISLRVQKLKNTTVHLVLEILYNESPCLKAISRIVFIDSNVYRNSYILHLLVKQKQLCKRPLELAPTLE